ncbi:phosphoenolpyruvate--protein phosphotransferase [Thermicanus aegyptius]|uniref:phosphoenolpyruvate--protein phosphotransferase n=1 Tax=Thermicanus aegyptius TaxID=94009 RepID=UPI000421572E|nr:phosphoenolpyruvate--protein phosphotransferase [Thermicanus aegyptius]
MSRVFHGIAASPGIAIGRAARLERQELKVEKREILSPEDEIERFKQAITKAVTDLEEIYQKTLKELGEEKASIFQAHQMLLQDPVWTSEVENRIREESINGEYAIEQVTEQYISLFSEMEDEYMRERAADLKDVKNRVLAYLTGTNRRQIHEQTPSILVAHDLTPSDTAQLDRKLTLGFVTEIGGRTSHSAIMARSLEIPAVVGIGEILGEVRNGDLLIVDGLEGEIHLNPDPETVARFEEKRERYLQEKEGLKKLVDQPTITRDGHQVEIAANIGTPKDVEGALRNGAEGIGLFRTEFLYMDRDTFPTEEEQFAAYKEVVEKMKGKPVIIRTLDIGGDKEIPYLDMPKEMNPFLGYRAIRLCLDRTELFKTQLRAILRASAYGRVKIMFPMVTTLSEVREAKRILHEIVEEFREQKIPFSSDLEVGIMVETPASAVIADILAKEVDFFSIGTNDLIQYTMAADRMNERVSYLYQPYHPAILRLVKMVIDAAHKEGKWAGMCGEMAGDPIAIPILLGLGLDEFSMSSSSILTARQKVGSLSYSEMKTLAEQALEQETQEKVKDLVRAAGV